jgi:hypothetical protein
MAAHVVADAYSPKTSSAPISNSAPLMTTLPVAIKNADRWAELALASQTQEVASVAPVSGEDRRQIIATSTRNAPEVQMQSAQSILSALPARIARCPYVWKGKGGVRMWQTPIWVELCFARDLLWAV